MAIQIKSLNANAAIKKIGIPQEKYDLLAQSPIATKLTASQLFFTFPSEDGEFYEYTLPLSLTALQKLNTGQLGIAEKLKLATEISEAIDKIFANHGDWLAKLKSAAAAAAPAGTLGKLPPLQPAKTAMTYAEAMASKTGKQLPAGKPAGEAKWPSFDLTKIKTADLVKLRDATMMYQPVFGSSSTSRYFMVGANADVRVAARYRKGLLSIRIEGPKWTPYKNAIAACGFSKVDVTGGYASVHLEVGNDPLLASKTLGAVLTGLGIPFETPIPNLAVIK